MITYVVWRPASALFSLQATGSCYTVGHGDTGGTLQSLSVTVGRCWAIGRHNHRCSAN